MQGMQSGRSVCALQRCHKLPQRQPTQHPCHLAGHWHPVLPHRRRCRRIRCCTGMAQSAAAAPVPPAVPCAGSLRQLATASSQACPLQVLQPNPLRYAPLSSSPCTPSWTSEPCVGCKLLPRLPPQPSQLSPPPWKRQTSSSGQARPQLPAVLLPPTARSRPACGTFRARSGHQKELKRELPSPQQQMQQTRPYRPQPSLRGRTTHDRRRGGTASAAQAADACAAAALAAAISRARQQVRVRGLRFPGWRGCRQCVSQPGKAGAAGPACSAAWWGIRCRGRCR